jgi:hypothetical protein
MVLTEQFVGRVANCRDLFTKARAFLDARAFFMPPTFAPQSGSCPEQAQYTEPGFSLGLNLSFETEKSLYNTRDGRASLLRRL